eukprot:CCRYP_009128-RA/>CCRYP_009128-RA protein AED:0.16 eAED:0.16 QI:240/1/1/1/1/1/4/322/677
MTAKKVAGGRGGGKGAQGQGQMSQGRGRIGMGSGRGRGRMMQQGRGQIMQGRGRGQTVQGRGGTPAQPQVLLKSLQDHLLLHIFNMLDNKGRVNAFKAIGWSTKRYVQRRENLRMQMENKAKTEREMAERMQWRNGIFKSVINAAVKNEDVEKGENEGEGKAGVTINDPAVDEGVPNGEEKKETDNGAPAEGMSKLSISEDTKPEEKEPLPYLGARVDPYTLLTRLNTRRLYGRLKHYKKETIRREEEEETMKENLRAKGLAIPEPSIIEIYERDLKEKLLQDRIYPKNLTIMQIAQKEWNELIEMANYRNMGHSLPFDPIPPKHELLLFQSCPRAVAVLASYPRSGNSLMRTLYEHTTLRVTGSDMQGGLAKHDLVGEMAVGEGMVQFVKTHFPERLGTPAFRCSRAVLLVRNPFDAIESFFHLMMTGEHTATLSEENRKKAEKVFDEYAVKEAAVWTKFHEYWLNQDIPILLIRYEDLYRQTDKVMERVLQFVLEVKRMGTFFTERVDRCIREQQKIESLGSYKPRSAGIGKSLKKYKPEVIERMKTPAMLEVMKKLGYSFMLENPVEKWSEMPPLQGYATEIMTATAFLNEQNTIILNNDRSIISRGQAEFTPWQKIKQELGIIENNCDCDNCAKRKQLAAGSSDGAAGEGLRGEGTAVGEAAATDTSAVVTSQ